NHCQNQQYEQKPGKNEKLSVHQASQPAPLANPMQVVVVRLPLEKLRAEKAGTKVHEQTLRKMMQDRLGITGKNMHQIRFRMADRLGQPVNNIWQQSDGSDGAADPDRPDF